MVIFITDLHSFNILFNTSSCSFTYKLLRQATKLIAKRPRVPLNLQTPSLINVQRRFARHGLIFKDGVDGIVLFQPLIVLRGVPEQRCENCGLPYAACTYCSTATHCYVLTPLFALEMSTAYVEKTPVRDRRPRKKSGTPFIGPRSAVN